MSKRVISLPTGEYTREILFMADIESMHNILYSIQEIKLAISRLSPEQLATFREWFDEFDAKAWDEQLELDAMSGKLDELANQAISDFRAGKCKEL